MFIGKPQITAVIAWGRGRLNYTFDDKSEVIEEYDKNKEIIEYKRCLMDLWSRWSISPQSRNSACQ